MSVCLLAACAAPSTAPRPLGPEEVALATYRAASLDREAFFALSEHMGQERSVIERGWKKHTREAESLRASSIPEMTTQFYDAAVAGVAVDPRLRKQVADLNSAVMGLVMTSDCRVTGTTPLAPADNGNVRVSVALACRHPEWTALQTADDAALSATERMGKIVDSVRRGAEGPRTRTSTSSLILEQHLKGDRKEWVVDRGRETDEALLSVGRGNLQSFDVPMMLAADLLRAESVRVFERTPWEKLPANGLGPQRVAVMAIHAHIRMDKDDFFAYWRAAGRSDAEIKRTLWPAAVDTRRALVPQKNWVEKRGGRDWPIFEASLKALESAVCEAGDVRFWVNDFNVRRHVGSVQMQCQVPTLHYLPATGWSVNTNQMVPVPMSSPLHVSYESVYGAKRWIAGEHAVAWTTTALFKVIYAPAAGVPTDAYVGDDPCTALLSIHGGDPDSAECR